MSTPLQCDGRSRQFRLCPHFPYPPLPYTLQDNRLPKDNSYAKSETSQAKHFHRSKYVIYFLLTKSGLTAAVKASKINLSKAEDTFLDFVKKHTSAKECPLAGNSVHADKKFLDKYMPRFMNHLHYRIVDVSSIKELCR